VAYPDWIGDIPGAPILISPNGTINIKQPTYKWNALSTATSYRLLVDDSSGRGVINKVYTAAEAGCAAGTGTCTLTPSTSLVNGSAAWWVAAGNTAGWGPWSTAMGFKVQVDVIPAAPTPISPNGTISIHTPNYTWNAVSNATHYQLVVKDAVGNAVINTVYAASAAGCTAGTGTCSLTPSANIPSGNATWWVAAWNSAGWSPWSAAMGFTVKDAEDPIVGLWNKPDGGQLRIEKRTTGSYDYVGTVTVQSAFWKERGMKIGDEVLWLDKQTDGHYRGSELLKGNLYWTLAIEVWVKGNAMTDSAGKVVATRS
jgi:hypothetical protein